MNRAANVGDQGIVSNASTTVSQGASSVVPFPANLIEGEQGAPEGGANGLRNPADPVVVQLPVLGRSVSQEDLSEAGLPSVAASLVSEEERELEIARELESERVRRLELGRELLELFSGNIVDESRALELIRAGADLNVKNSNGETSFHLAAGKDCDSVVRELAKYGVDVNLMNSKGFTALHSAVKADKVKRVRMLLDVGVDATITSTHGVSILHWAAYHGHTDIVNAALGAGCDVDALDAEGNTPLHCAARLDQLDTINALVAAGANVRILNKKGSTPLHEALRDCYLHSKTIFAFIKAGVDVRVRDVEGLAALHLVAGKYKGHNIEVTKTLDIINGLVEAGADVAVGDKNDATPFHHAARVTNLEVMEALYKLKPDLIHARTKQGATPLHWAASNNYLDLEAVEMLLRNGAEVNAKDEDGSTPLHNLVCVGSIFVTSEGYQSNTQALERLLAAGADVKAVGLRGFTPLHWAVYTGKTESVQILLKAGADVNVRDAEGWTPFHHAAFKGWTAILQILLEQENVDAHMKTNAGDTPLHLAASRAWADVIALLYNETDANGQNSKGETPLHLAAGINPSRLSDQSLAEGHVHSKIHGGPEALRENRQNMVWQLLCAGANPEALRKNIEEVVWRLLCVGADPETCDNNLTTALYGAAANGWLEVVQLLLQQLPLDAVVTVVNQSDKKDGYTPLFKAVLGGHLAVVEVLLNAGADAKAQNKWGSTPLHFATSTWRTIADEEISRKEIMDALFEVEVDVNAGDQNGETALHWGVSRNYLEAVRHLIKAGKADVNVQNEVGDTPLHGLMREMSNEKKKDELLPMLELLLIEGNADVNIRNQAGGTPAGLAARNGIDLSEILSRKAAMKS